MGDAPICRIEAVFAAEAAVRLQPFPGSTWRGAVAAALKRIVCAMRFRPCAGCPLDAVCLYPALFGGEGAVAVRSFVLAPDPLPRGGVLLAGDRLTLRLVLLPALARARPYLERALVEAGERGLTGQRVPFRTVAIRHETIAPAALFVTPATTGACRIAFVTPLRLRLGGDLVTPERLTAAMLIDAAVRRVRLLGLPAPPLMLVRAREQGRELHLNRPRLRWCETVRVSTRQNMRLHFGGIVGEAEVDCAAAAEAAALLHAATVLHLGKGAAMGFGRIALAPIPPPVLVHHSAADATAHG